MDGTRAGSGRRGSSYLLLLLLLAPQGAGVAAGESAPVPGPADLETILREARSAQFSDMAAWSRFRFRRQVEKQKLGPAGEVLGSEHLDFLLTPAGEGFDELIQRVDGREPNAAELREHRRQARFSKHHAGAIAGGSGGEEDSGLALARLLRVTSYRHAGLEGIEGHLCHRIDFSPPMRSRARGFEDRIAEALEGSLWITVEGNHLARAVARSTKPVSIALSFAKLHGLNLTMEAMPVARDVWSPRRIEVRADARISWVPVRRRTVYSYSEFEPVRHSEASAFSSLAP